MYWIDLLCFILLILITECLQRNENSDHPCKDDDVDLMQNEYMKE